MSDMNQKISKNKTSIKIDKKSTKEELPNKLTCEITETMLEKAFSFGRDYFHEPAKVLRDRTGQKERGLGEIITANMFGKVIELGVCEILKNNSGKQFFPDMEVKSEFDYGKPDIVKVLDEKKKEKKLDKFVEIKFSPSNYEWIGLYTSQFKDMIEYVKKNFSFKNPSDEIIIIYANIKNKKTGKLLFDNIDNTQVIGNSVLTESEKEEVEKLDKELTQLKKDFEDKTKFPKTISSRNMPNSLFPGMNIAKARETNKKNKENMKKKIAEKEGFMKKLTHTMQKRKEDLLGIYFKHKKFLSDKFDYFLNITDLEVEIEYVITGKELEEHGKIFPSQSIMPSNKIFFGKGKEEKTFEENDLNNTAGKIHKKIRSKKRGGKTIIPIEHITFKHNFSQQFGDLLCEGDVEFFKQTKNDQSTLFLKCNSDVKVTSDFLGIWKFEKNEIRRIMQENTLPGRDGKPGLKNTSDIFIPKRNFSSLVTNLDKRVIEIAKKI
jgi:hypothetical protein